MTEDRMKFDEVHFDNAKGHAAALLKNAEKALGEGNVQYAGWSLDDARSYLLTMSQELEREGATAAARTKYDELKARYDALEPKYETMKDAIEKEEEIAAANEQREKEEEERRRKEEAELKQFDADCDKVERLLYDYAGELAENHSESCGTEKAIFNRLVHLQVERRELIQNVFDERCLRFNRLEGMFHCLKRLGVIARRFEEIKGFFK